MSDLIASTRDGPIATVVLDRPDRLNALTRDMWQALGDRIAALSADDDLRCIIVRGAGDRAFSPGNDIAEFATARATKAQAIEYGRVMHATAHALAACRHPLVAQIHGVCVGGGLEIAALCDLRICGDVEPLRCADQEPGSRDGLRRNGAAGETRRARRSRWRSCSKAGSSTPRRRRTRDSSPASCRMPTSRPKPLATAQRIADGAPLVARWHKQIRAPPGGSAPADGRGARRMLRLLRHRGLPHRVRGVPRQAEDREFRGR